MPACNALTAIHIVRYPCATSLHGAGSLAIRRLQQLHGQCVLVQLAAHHSGLVIVSCLPPPIRNIEPAYSCRTSSADVPSDSVLSLPKPLLRMYVCLHLQPAAAA